MILLTLQISCYLPNATFSYNPILLSGYLEATFIDVSDDIYYYMCKQLDGKLFRVEIDLAQDEVTVNGQQQIARVALSENGYFRLDYDIKIRLFVEAEDDAAAYRTTQSNFRLQFMETDAAVYYTLSFFAIYTYNTEECFQDVQLQIERGVMTVTGFLKECELGFTNFGRFVGSAALQRDDAKAYFKVTGFGTIYVNVGVEINESFQRGDGYMAITIKCYDLGYYDAKICDSMTEYLQQNTLYEIQFKLLFQVTGTQYWIELTQDITMFEDEKYAGCLSANYIISPSFLVVKYTIANESHCTIPNYEHLRIKGTIQAETKYSDGLYYDLEDASGHVVRKYGTLIAKCADYVDYNACIESFSQFVLMESSIFQMKFNFEFADGKRAFMAAQLQRSDYCFGAMHLELQLNELEPGHGAVKVQLYATNNQNCEMLVPMRRLLTININQQDTSSAGATYAPQQLLQLTLRDDFSYINTSLIFDCEDCISQLNKIGYLAAQGSVIGSLQIDYLMLYSADLSNKVVIEQQGPCAGIAIALGAVLSLIGYCMNDWYIQQRLRYRHKLVVKQAPSNGKANE